MNWRKTVFMLGAVLLCTSLLMANTPPGNTTAATNQVAPAPASPAQLTPLDAPAQQPEKKRLTVPAKPSPVAVTPRAAKSPLRGAVMDILIFTDSYPSETTWDVRPQAGGDAICSGGPYDMAGYLYEESCDVDPAECYIFTIYDAYGDGICCSYGNGWYEVYYEGELFCSGGQFGTSESCTLGGGCVWPEGACCVNQECVATNIEPQCDSMGGTFYEGETCPEFECPGSLVECPPGTLFGQNPHDPGASWSFGTSAVTTGFTYLIQENYEGVDSPICDIHWWGLSLLCCWTACDPAGVTFDITFYQDAGGVPGAVVCSYTGLLPTYVGTGQFYSGFEMLYYSVELLNPCCMLENGWVSIQSQMNANDCAFLWASSPQGNGDSLQNGGSTGYDRGVCLTGEYVERWGACCDDATGICEDNVEQQQCPPPMRFTEDTLCIDLDPPCGEIPGACCYPDFTCEITTEMGCVDGDWIGAYTTCDECPPPGACCIDYVCVATTTEDDCDGAWFEGETCPEFVCPETLADFIVTAPYTSPLRGTCGEGDDCNLRSGEEHQYEVIIPHLGEWNFNTCLDTSWDTYIFLGTQLCTQDLGYNDDSCGLQSEIQVVVGPGNYFCDIEGYSTCGNYIFDVHEIIPPSGACCVDMVCVETDYEYECDTLDGDWYEGEECPGFVCPPPCGQCPEGGIPEAEPCGSDTNGGCNMASPTFEPIECGVTICGTGWFDGSTRDTDWYELVLDESSILTMTLQAEFDALFGKIGQYVPGVPGCANTTGSVDPYALPLECQWATVTTTCLPAGTYYVFVAPQFTNIYTCPSNYVLTVECEPCVILGACCVDEVCVETDELPDCDALGGTWYVDQTCPEFICPHPGPDFVVDAPYTSPLRSACGSDDCSLRAGDDHSYEVNIPYAAIWNFNTCLDTSWDTYCFLGTEWCTQDLGYNDDSCGLQSEIIVDIPAGTYQFDIEGYSTTCGSYIFNVRDVGVGACCYFEGEELLCVDNHEAECDALDGDFYLGETCDTFECPPPCEESQIDIAIMTDPYPSETTWVITNHLPPHEVICSGGPYANANTLYNERCCIPYDGCVDFTMYDSYGDGIYAPGGFTIVLDGEVIYSNMGSGWSGYEIHVNNFGLGCIPDTGACCDLDLNCIATNTEDECDAMGGNWYIFEDCDAGYECLAHCWDCPSNGMPEGEPVCEDNYEDMYNGGCNSSPYVFQDILCDEIICGESGTFYFNGSSYRDTDWYRVVITEPTTLGWSVCAEFEVLIFVINGGTENCSDYTILGYTTAPAEQNASLSFAVNPGVYWLWAGPTVFGSGVPCGSEYVGRVTGVAPCICGDFDNDDDVDVDDYYFFLDAFGSCEGDPKYEEACDFDGDGCITLVDYQMWMQCYRDANGKAFVAPTQQIKPRPAGQKAPKGAVPR
jgi:hypothetical protein